MNKLLHSLVEIIQNNNQSWEIYLLNIWLKLILFLVKALFLLEQMLIVWKINTVKKIKLTIKIFKIFSSLSFWISIMLQNK